MNKELSGKGYIRGGEGHFLTSTGDLYRYHEGVLTPEAACPNPSPEPDQTRPQGATEMSYQGTFELQPLYDRHQSFYGKAFVERWSTENGVQLVLKSYGTVAAKVTPVVTRHDGQEVFHVEIGMKHLSATTLRHVKEFLAQADDVFKGVTLAWLRKAIKDGRPVEGEAYGHRRVYTLDEL